MAPPRDFFAKMVRPAYEEWVSDPLIEWKAKAAVSNCDTMAERTFVFWKDIDRAQVGGSGTVRVYRQYLKDHVCADFGLVWDIHDNHKHFELDRGNRQVTRADQTGVGRLGCADHLEKAAGGGLKEYLRTAIINTSE